MTKQHISFTSDEEIDESHFINYDYGYGFPPSLSPLTPPKRNQSTHAKYDDHEIPVDGVCFSSLSFDWDVGVAEEEAQPTVAHFSLQQSASANRSTETQPLLHSYDAYSPVASSSCHWEIQHPFTMQRTYPSYSAQPTPTPIASNAPREFLSAVQRSTCSTPTSYDSAHLPCNGTVNDPTLNTPDNQSAEYYSKMLQAAADHVFEQQQASASACAPDAEAVELYSVDVASPAPPRSNIACDSPELKFFYDEQPDQEEVRSVESGSLLKLKEDVLDFNLDDITSGAESNIGQDLLQDQDHHPTRLSISSDQQFLDPVHNFLRSSCLEVFVCRMEHNDNASGSEGPGHGTKHHKEGQIGLRCAHCKHIPKGKRANQAVSYPSKTLHIFESVRNYQRIHFEACEYIPTELKMMHRELVSNKSARKVQLKYIKAYFAEAACEIGMVETPNNNHLKCNFAFL